MALRVAAIAVRGLWFKYTYPGSPALPEREPAPNNRWQRGDVVDALYLADSEETVWAEWYRPRLIRSKAGYSARVALTVELGSFRPSSCSTSRRTSNV